MWQGQKHAILMCFTSTLTINHSDPIKTLTHVTQKTHTKQKLFQRVAEWNWITSTFQVRWAIDVSDKYKMPIKKPLFAPVALATYTVFIISVQHQNHDNYDSKSANADSVCCLHLSYAVTLEKPDGIQFTSSFSQSNTHPWTCPHEGATKLYGDQ